MGNKSGEHPSAENLYHTKKSETQPVVVVSDFVSHDASCQTPQKNSTTSCAVKMRRNMLSG